MAPKQGPLTSSGSDSDPRSSTIDQRKMKRMLSNRESARRSRVRKQKQLEDLVKEMSKLQNDNAVFAQRINATTQRYMEIESANNVLRAQAMELTERLQSLDSVLQIVEHVGGGLEMETPDPIMNPWQIPCPIQAAEMFQY